MIISTLADKSNELLHRIALGDEHAFRIFFKEHWPQVYCTALRLTKAPEKAEDLSQEVFIKIWENRTKLVSIKHLEGYIYTLTRNLVLDFLRKKVFVTENINYLVHYFHDDTLMPHEKLEYKELESTLEFAMSSLSGNVGEVFRLSRIEGLSHEQIAKKLDISVVTSKTYIVRALKEIRKHMMLNSDITVLVIASFLLK